MRKNMLSLLALTIGSILLLSMSERISNPQEIWKVPEEYENMRNPYSGVADDDQIGEEIYGLYCLSCHGETGKGDGVNANLIETTVADFSVGAFKSQTDGSLYYKIATGRNQMPGFEAIIAEEEDLWFVVNYIRSF